VAWANTQAINRPDWYRELLQGGVVDVLASPGADYPYDLSPGNTYHGTSFQLTASSKTNLLTYLADSDYRNFYFYGHGNEDGIGDWNPTQGWLVWIGTDDLCKAMSNTISGPISHPYRFVFLDSCKSAAGNLCECFGIMKERLSISYMRSLSIKSRAFLGYTEGSKLPGNHDQILFNEAMLGVLLAEWRDGVSLNGSVARAKQNQNWPLDSSATIYGAQNLWRFCPY
jgi:hypothetical protein